MARKDWRQRCGQCGRRYTKAQWRRNDFWCPTCKKFVCFECVTRGMICPACGTRTNRRIGKFTTLGTAFGIVLIFQSSIVLFVSVQNSDMFWVATVEMTLGAVLIGASLTLFVAKKNQVKMHEAYLSELPGGTIPLELRPGYGNPTVYQKWREANLARSPRQSVLMKDAYPDHIYYGLLGDWDFPVVSKQERIAMTSKIQNKALFWGSGMVGFGIVIMLLGSIATQHPVAFGFGLIILLVGLLIISLAGHAKRLVKSDVEAEVKVAWKTIGFKKAKAAMEEFLLEQGLQARIRTTNLPMWHHPEYRYDLPDGNYISFIYSEDGSGHVYGWIAIGFRPSSSLAARRVQQDLDEFLSQRDLIRRAG